MFKNNRMMTIFTTLKWGWNDSLITYKMKSCVAKAACCQVVYDYGFNFFSLSQLSVWKKKKILLLKGTLL